MSHLPISLPAIIALIPVYSPLVLDDLLNPQPKLMHLSAQNSFASRTESTFVHPHPKYWVYSFWLVDVSLFIWKCIWSSAYFSCSKVLMLKPSVGEMVSIGSPLILFKIVVLPALSKPLEIDVGFRNVTSMYQMLTENLQHKNTHLFFILSVLLQYSKQAHDRIVWKDGWKCKKNLGSP